MSALNTTSFDDVELESKLTVKQLRFVNEYMLDSNATQAAIRAGYSEHTAGEQGYDLLKRPQVIWEIKDRLGAAAAAASVSAERIIAELKLIAFADANELHDLIVRPCLKCWPAGLTLEDPNPLCDSPVIVEDFNMGGCGGAGIRIVKLTPTKKLSRGAAKLISAIRQKKDGSIEFELRSQDKALEMLGRVRGIFKDVRELSGPGGAPIALTAIVEPKQLTDEQILMRIAQLEGISGGTSQVIEGNQQEVKRLEADSAPYVPVTGSGESC